MRRHLTLLLCIAAAVAQAQVACDILTPGPIQGSYAHTWAEPETGSWNTPDMLDPHERVVGNIVLALDGSASDSLCCETLANAAEISGKIAVVYRGTCDYSLKAKYCQDAGAIGVVIINNIPGPPAAMGPGDIGTQVTIPVFQIRQEDGAAWRDALEGGAAVEALLGNKDGYYDLDAGMRKPDVLLPPSLAYPRWLAANAGEYQMEIATKVHNYGLLTMSGMHLHATVTRDGSTLYDEVSAPFELPSGDSATITLPDFVQSSWTGRYELTYALQTGDPDQHEMDNLFTVPFEFNEVYALAPIDEATGIPVTTIGMQPATPSGEYESCVHFRDVNASRIALTGVDRYASITDPLSLNGEFVYTRVYQWLDNFTGLSDPTFAISVLAPVHDQKHILDVDDGQTQTYLPFSDPLVLDDNVRYLVCTATINPEIFFGYNEDVHYGLTEDTYDQPTCPNHNGSNWYVGFVGGPVASIGVHAIDANTIGIAEQEETLIGAFPNPGRGLFQIAMSKAAPVQLTVRDATGRLVRTLRSSGERTVIDLTAEAPGVYLLTVEGEHGRVATRLVKE